MPFVAAGFQTPWKNRRQHDLNAARSRLSLAALLGNIAVPYDMVRARRKADAIAREFPGDGRPVLLIPGFLASEYRMERMRSTLETAGYSAFHWDMGRNLGPKFDSREQLDARVDAIRAETDEAVTLVGWSLGGLLAREYAKFAPKKVRAVLTLGSPFSGDPRANRAWRIYEMIARHSVDAPPFTCVRNEKPPVPTWALWSRRDGVIVPECTSGMADERDRAVEVDCTHMGFAAAPEGIRAVLASLPSL